MIFYVGDEVSELYGVFGYGFKDRPHPWTVLKVQDYSVYGVKSSIYNLLMITDAEGTCFGSWINSGWCIKK